MRITTHAVWAVLWIAACRIPDATFTPSGGGDGGSVDGSGGDAGDAAMAGALRNGYSFEGNTVHHITKNATTGALIAVPPTVALSSPTSAAVNRQGTHVFFAERVGAAGQVRQMTIQPNGSIMPSSSPVSVQPCSPGAMTVHPNGQWLAVGCTSPHLAIVKLDASGQLDTTVAAFVVPVNGAIPQNPAFAQNGTCLVVADSSTAAPEYVRVFAFNTVSGMPSPRPGGISPVSPGGIAVHPNGAVVYAAGGSLVTYAINPQCVLSQMDSDPTGPGIARHIVVDAAGARAYVAADNVHSFALDAAGIPTKHPANPFVTIAGITYHAIMDPAMPNLLYLSSSNAGVQVAVIDATGALAFMPLGVQPSATCCSWFTMAP